MQTEALIEAISRQFTFDSDVRIIRLPQEAPTEVIFETDPTSAHSGEKSTALALLLPGGSVEHMHRRTIEHYHIVQGAVRLYRRDAPDQPCLQTILNEGEGTIINTHTWHKAEPVGEYAVVEVYSQPGWTPEDHILA